MQFESMTDLEHPREGDRSDPLERSRWFQSGDGSSHFLRLRDGARPHPIVTFESLWTSLFSNVCTILRRRGDGTAVFVTNLSAGSKETKTFSP